MRVCIASETHADVRPAVLTGLAAFNALHLGPYRSLPLAISARDAEGVIVGGAVGRLDVDCFFLDLLWVCEAYRCRGVGSRILRTIEDEARGHGAKAMLLDTFDFQAAPFYERQGYVEEACLVAMFGGHDRIYLTKRNL